MSRVLTAPSYLLMISLLVACSLVPASAGTLEVGASKTYATIQAAVNAAVATDEVVVYPGTYNEAVYLLGRGITLRSTNPASATVRGTTIIHGNGGTANGVTFAEGSAAADSLLGLTVTGAYAGVAVGNGLAPTSPPRTGGVQPAGAVAPIIKQCVIQSNIWTGIMVGADIAPVIESNSILSNLGSGISCAGTPGATVRANTIANNTNWGIYCISSAVVLNGNLVNNNGKDGISLSATTGNVWNSTVRNNGAWGVICDNSPGIENSLDLFSNVITDNFGGGIACMNGSAPVIRKCLIRKSQTAVFCSGSSSPQLINDTISWGVEGVWADDSSCWPSLNSCIVWGFSDFGVMGSNNNLTVRYCDVGNCEMNYAYMTDPTGHAGNISVDPLFADSNNGDYHLKSQAGRYVASTKTWVKDDVTSPCLDRGNPAGDFHLEPAPNGGRINMGCYGGTAQASKTPASPVLYWPGTTGYTTDGVAPNTGTPETSFTFKVKYKQAQGAAPSFVRLYVYLPGGGMVPGTPFDMTAGGSTYTSGVIYTKSITLNAHGKYGYFFAAECAGQVVNFPDSVTAQGPIVNNQPALAWAGVAGYMADGVAPDSGVANSVFTFKVKYADADAAAPAWMKLHVWNPDGSEMVGSPFGMVRAAGTPDWTAGWIFVKSLRLNAVGTCKYQFEANDGLALVKLPAATAKDGPVVTAGSPVAPLALAARAVGAGCQVTYTLAAPADVDAVVLNLAGRVVARLAAGTQEAGVQTLAWNGRNLAGSLAPAGTYLVQVTARGADGAQSTAACQVRR